jgi:hypothetical protein
VFQFFNIANSSGNIAVNAAQCLHDGIAVDGREIGSGPGVISAAISGVIVASSTGARENESAKGSGSVTTSQGQAGSQKRVHHT